MSELPLLLPTPQRRDLALVLDAPRTWSRVSMSSRTDQARRPERYPFVQSDQAGVLDVILPIQQ